MNIKRNSLIIILSSLALLFLTPFIGLETVGFSSIFDPASSSGKLLYQIRIPRIMLSFFIGGILSISGLVFQSIFKNPIATPYTLGVASGASMGVAIYFSSGLASILSIGYFGSTFFAMVGAIFVIAIVYGLSLYNSKLQGNNILLAGVAISFFCSAVIMFMQYFSSFTESYRLTRYMIGTLSGANISNILYILPIAIIGFAIIFFFHRELDIIGTGDELAASKGVNVSRSITILYLSTSFIVACSVAIAGPIGFVGMMVPHITRNLVGYSNRTLIPISFLFGGAFLTACDTLARQILAPVELPVGIITNLLGAPFFIFLIIKGKKI